MAKNYVRMYADVNFGFAPKKREHRSYVSHKRWYSQDHMLCPFCIVYRKRASVDGTEKKSPPVLSLGKNVNFTTLEPNGRR